MKLCVYLGLLALIWQQVQCNCCNNQCCSACESKCSTQSCKTSCRDNCCSNTEPVSSCCNNSCCTDCQSKCSTESCRTACRDDCCQDTKEKTSPNCCNNSCCSDCQSKCTTESCKTTCKENCCPAENGTPEKVRSTTEKTTGSYSSNNNTLIANASSYNNITNKNNINIAINVNSNVTNNIDNSCGSVTNKNCNDTVTVVIIPVTEIVTVTVNCDNATTPTPVTTPMPPTPAPNCCIIIIPCATLGCNPYHHTCNHCQGNYGFYPLNPCSGGCQRQPSWTRTVCPMGHCMSRQVDCSYCSHDYYQTYEGYSQCHGCFQN